MANRYAVATGNWSDTATWDGGTLPGVGDVVRPNGYTVTIDQDLPAVSLNNRASSPAVAGGQFVVSSIVDVRNIAAEINGADGTTNYLFVVSATSGTINFTGAFYHTAVVGNMRYVSIDGAVTANFANTLEGAYASGRIVRINASATVTFSGSIVSSMSSGIFIYIDVGATGAIVIFTASIVSGLTSAGLFYINAVCDVTINGDLYSSNYTAVDIVAAATVTINGNCVGTASSSPLLRIASAASLTVNGNLTGGTGASNISYGLEVTGSNATVQVNGDLIGGGTSHAIYWTGATGVLTVNGGVVASGIAALHVWFNVSPVVRLKGPFYHGPNNVAPVRCLAWMVFANTSTAWVVKDDSASPSTGADVTLSNALAGVPAVTDVRAGTSFGGGGSLTGTLAVPAPSSVAAGVATDDTVGTAVLTADTLWNHEVSTGVAAKDRLLATSTVDSTGAQIAAATDAP